MRRFLYVSTITLFLVSSFFTYNSQAGEIIKGPWLQNVKTDSITIIWESSHEEIEAPLVEYGMDYDDLFTVEAIPELILGSYYVYKAVISGLEPGTIYWYRVESGGTITANYTFRTAPENGSTGFRYYVAGDNRSAPGVWEEITLRIKDDMESFPDRYQTFLLNSGDIVANGRHYDEYQEQVFLPELELLTRLPMYVGFGNHEDRNSEESDALLYGFFDFPYIESGSSNEKWYSIDFGNVHLAVYALWASGRFISGPQRDWIEQDLLTAKLNPHIDWRFALMHETPWSLGEHGQDESPAVSLRTYLHPVFSAYELDVGFGGHNHLYARYAPVDGVTYITTGGAGAWRYSNEYAGWEGADLMYYQGEYHFVIVDVYEQGVCIRAIDIEGNRIDYVTFGGTEDNKPPIADAGKDQSAAQGCSFVLHASASEDPEGAPLYYQWLQLEGPEEVQFSDSTAEHCTVTVNSQGNYLFELSVSDGENWSTPDHVRIEVSTEGTLIFNPSADTFVDVYNPDINYGSSTALEVDDHPVKKIVLMKFDVQVCGVITAAALRMYCFGPGDPGEIKICSSDWEEEEVTYNNMPPVNDEIFEDLAGNPAESWIEIDLSDVIVSNKTYTIVVWPTGADGTDYYSREGERPPELVVQLLPFSPPIAVAAATVIHGVAPSQVIFDGSESSDPDGGDLQSWHWNQENTLLSTEAMLEQTFSVPGDYTVTLTVVDDEGESATDSVSFTIFDEPSPEVEEEADAEEQTELEEYVDIEGEVDIEEEAEIEDQIDVADGQDDIEETHTEDTPRDYTEDLLEDFVQSETSSTRTPYERVGGCHVGSVSGNISYIWFLLIIGTLYFRRCLLRENAPRSEPWFAKIIKT